MEKRSAQASQTLQFCLLIRMYRNIKRALIAIEAGKKNCLRMKIRMISNYEIKDTVLMLPPPPSHSPERPLERSGQSSTLKLSW